MSRLKTSPDTIKNFTLEQFCHSSQVQIMFVQGATNHLKITLLQQHFVKGSLCCIFDKSFGAIEIS